VALQETVTSVRRKLPNEGDFVTYFLQLLFELSNKSNSKWAGAGNAVHFSWEGCKQKSICWT
jgi:hypothetical protein